MIGTNRYIGSPVERIEDPRFLRGRGQFHPSFPNQAVTSAARSTNLGDVPQAC
jgi:hypothetical protein